MQDCPNSVRSGAEARMNKLNRTCRSRVDIGLSSWSNKYVYGLDLAQGARSRVAIGLRMKPSTQGYHPLGWLELHKIKKQKINNLYLHACSDNLSIIKSLQNAISLLILRGKTHLFCPIRNVPVLRPPFCNSKCRIRMRRIVTLYEYS